MAVEGHPPGVIVIVLAEVVDEEVDIRGTLTVSLTIIIIVFQTEEEDIHDEGQEDPEVVLGQMNRHRRTMEPRLYGTR